MTAVLLALVATLWLVVVFGDAIYEVDETPDWGDALAALGRIHEQGGR